MSFWPKCTKIDFCWGSIPDPAGELYSTPRLADFKKPSFKGREEKGRGKEGEKGRKEEDGMGRRLPLVLGQRMVNPAASGSVSAKFSR